MNDKPPFDLVKATFYLVAGVFAVYALLIIIAILICAYNLTEVIQAKQHCMKEGGMLEALYTLLASALAFAAGRSQPPPKQ